ADQAETIEAGEAESPQADEDRSTKVSQAQSPQADEDRSTKVSQAESPQAAEELAYGLIQQRPIIHAEFGTGSISLRLVKLIYHRLFGRLPRVRMLHPFWAPLHHVNRLVDRAAGHGARNVLMVGRGVVDGIADHLPGMHAQL